MSCRACEALTIDGLFDRTYTAPGHMILHSSYNLLEAAAKNGCNTCRAFDSRFRNNFVDLKARLALLEARGAVPPVVVFVGMGVPQNDQRPLIQLHVQIGDEPERPGVEQLKISFRVSKSRDFKQEHEHARYSLRYIELDHDLGSDQNFKIAQDWIRECCVDHDPARCPQVVDVDLPTRLIDVGMPGNHEALHLVETSKGKKGRYLALSHCWGPPEAKKLLTTTQTLASRLLSIDQSEMPPNFSDAVIITRKLGFRFLWIDSLCIIQDSKSDWEIESQNMGKIYTNAVLTIAAAAASSSEGGLLKKSYQPVSDDRLNPKEWFLGDSIGRGHNFFKLANEKGDEQLESSGTKTDSYTCRMKLNRDDEAQSIALSPLSSFSDLEETWFRCTSVSPLAVRGWCLQERLLSPRVLYYGIRQIYWQCASSRKAADGEDVPAWGARSHSNLSNELSEWPDILSLRQLHREAMEDGSAEQLQATETKIYKTWHNVLFLYVNRRLTYYSDRLPGLAGMATLIHELTGDQYVAGFWRRNLLVSLVWTPTRTVLREYAPRVIAEQWEREKPEWEKETSIHSGPSWSWCSADLADVLSFVAEYNEANRMRLWQEQDAKIADVKVNLVGNNPFGQVKSGEIVLRGFTYPRWDTRAIDVGGWQSTYQSGSDGESQDRTVLWDYWPRQTLSPAKRVWKHFIRLLVDLASVFLWQGLTGFYRDRSQTDCFACNKYLCMHILSIVDKAPGKDGRHEIDLHSLVLEPVPGEVQRYRRIGIARKAAYVSENDFLDATNSAINGKTAPKLFDRWNFQEIVII
ncbi:hypothetical protein EG329_014469 [Mollisiaceae sp. DMI_Dod_QoI]|nr:hypothetical protein EG329_014469 [Helotiales sp. DMI_Dod_QoI]